MNFPVLVIPVRYASSRLPAKALRLLKGKPLVQHVYERALLAADHFERIVIAVDDTRIEEVCSGFGAEVCMTSSDHESGSDRLAEVVQRYGWEDERIVVNLQGDEPLTPVANLKQLSNNLSQYPQAMMATLASPLHPDDLHDPNCVKVVRNDKGMALYFSRAPIPWQRDQDSKQTLAVSDYALHHIGMYAYRAGCLKNFAQLEPCILEQLEKLEQLRALYHGFPIHVDVAVEKPGPGVDTEADLRRVEHLLA